MHFLNCFFGGVKNDVQYRLIEELYAHAGDGIWAAREMEFVVSGLDERWIILEVVRMKVGCRLKMDAFCVIFIWRSGKCCWK